MENGVKEISPEIFSIVSDEADRRGLSVDDYLLKLMSRTPGELALGPIASEAEFEADMFSLGEDAAEAGSYTGSYSREDIYFDHD